MPSKLLGVHSARMDMLARDQQQDESLGLNCAWYASILLTLTESDGGEAADPSPFDSERAAPFPKGLRA